MSLVENERISPASMRLVLTLANNQVQQGMGSSWDACQQTWASNNILSVHSELGERGLTCQQSGD